MIAGNPNSFAIETVLTRAYERLSFRALGCFVIYLYGRRYGVYRPDATLLACSFEAVRNRIAHRGQHVAPFAEESSARDIAEAFYTAIYGEEDRRPMFLGIPTSEIRNIFQDKPSNCMWAPDGDAAFDDGSYVLQFDVDARVRLIGFKATPEFLIDISSVSDVWIPADDFYSLLQSWQEMFDTAWANLPKAAQEANG